MNPQTLADEPDYVPPILPKIPSVKVTIESSSETVSFRVIRYDARRLMMRGKAQAASTIGKRVALVLESQL